MKKTTYILGAILGVSFIFVFFLPAVLFRADTQSQQEDKVLILTPAPGVKEITLPNFKALCRLGFIQDLNTYLCYQNGLEFIPDFTIEESDSVSSPVLKLNSMWVDLVSTSIEEETLYLTVNAVSDEMSDNSDFYNVKVIIPDGETDMGVLTVPRGMLTQMWDMRANITLSNFKDASLDIIDPVYELKLQNCSFRSLIKKSITPY